MSGFQNGEATAGKRLVYRRLSEPPELTRSIWGLLLLSTDIESPPIELTDTVKTFSGRPKPSVVVLNVVYPALLSGRM